MLVVDLLFNRGFAIESVGDLNTALEDYLTGLDIAQSLNNQKFIAQGLINIGAIYYQTEEYKLSLSVLNDALKIANKLNDEDLQGFINTELGILYAYIGELDQSLKFYRTAYNHYHNIGKTSYAINALSNIATSYQEHGRYEEAIKIYKELTPSIKEMGNNKSFYSLYMGLSWSNLKKKQPDPESALQYLHLAEQYLPFIELPLEQLNFLIIKSYVLEGLQRYDEALDTLYLAEKKITAKEKAENNYNYLDIIGSQATIYRALGHYETAYKLYSEYTDRFIDYYQHDRIAAVQEVRLRYESEQAELKQQRLQKQAAVQAVELLKIKNSRQQQKMYFLLMALVVVIIAWLLHRLARGKTSLLYSARRDHLTGLYNRRRLVELGMSMLSKLDNRDALSLLMIDVDHFKVINDQFGHKRGDEVLKKIADIGLHVFRKNDVIARFGGEEFIVLLPKCDTERAKASAQRVQALIASNDWQDINGVTISVGIATLIVDKNNLHNKKAAKDTLERLIKVADDLLYRAKAQGRNQICV